MTSKATGRKAGQGQSKSQGVGKEWPFAFFLCTVQGTESERITITPTPGGRGWSVPGDTKGIELKGRGLNFVSRATTTSS